ncbi:hypothetical protein [Chitinophaga sp. MM2321]|uniref:hypothetical protein n=1 Tax=Chitinophaga sp. MM2321 TaxID=3137178 RepID=UPI0032D56A50
MSVIEIAPLNDVLPGGGTTTVVDNLDSTSATSALSANQGRVLDEKIEAIPGSGGDAETLDGETPAFYLDRANHTGSTPGGNVTQDATHRFVSDSDKAAWNAKQDALGFTPVSTTDSRLSDARTPTAHQHAMTDVTGLAAALAAKADGTTVTASLSGKVDKVTGKGLSTNDFTTAEKDKLAALEGSHFKGTYVSLSDLNAADVGGEGNYAYVDEGEGEDIAAYIWDDNDSQWVIQKGTSTAETAATIKTKYESNPDTNAFTDTEKTKLEGLENYDDTDINTAITNLGTTKADKDSVYTKSESDSALTGKANAATTYSKTEVDAALEGKANTSDLSTVATSGSFPDLTDKPKYEVLSELPADLSGYPDGSRIIITNE